MITGSIQPKRGKYYAVLRLPDAEGKVHQKWVNLNLPERNNKTEAKQRLAELLADYNRGNVIYTPEMDFADYLEQWLADVKPQLELSTWESYEIELRRHIVPFFRERPCKLSRVPQTAIREYCNMKLASGKLRGKGGLAPKTVKNHYGIIRKALQDAKNQGVITRNPAAAVEPPKVPKPKIVPYTQEQANALIAAAKGTDLYIPVLLGLFCGLRRGEILGLQWYSVNIAEKSITIQDTMTKTTTLLLRPDTKSESSYRTLPLPKAVVDALKEQKAWQAGNRAFLGAGYMESDLVCVRASGKTLGVGVTKRVQLLMKRAGLPVRDLHNLRHTNATLLYKRSGGNVKVLQSWLGHSESSVTLDRYTHLYGGDKEEFADLIGETLTV